MLIREGNILIERMNNFMDIKNRDLQRGRYMRERSLIRQGRFVRLFIRHQPLSLTL